MFECLILKLHGVLQAWGKHTYETFRPSELFPTRSGITGFLAAALGISRKDDSNIIALDCSYTYAARVDSRPEAKRIPSRMMDFHTIQEVRTVGKKTKETPILSRREYLEDCRFSIALRSTEGAKFSLSEIEAALAAPKFTLFLGRKSCPLTRPPLEKKFYAASLSEALKSDAGSGMVYSEEGEGIAIVVRDVPMGNRRFGTRRVYFYEMGEEP